MFRIFLIVLICQTFYSLNHHPSQNSSEDVVTLQLTAAEANQVYDVLNSNLSNNRILPGHAGHAPIVNRGRRRKIRGIKST